MKKLTALLFSLTLVLSFSSCSKNEETFALTLPPSFFNSKTYDEIQSEALSQGILSVVIQDNGFVTYTLTEKTHNSMLEQISNEIQDGILASLDSDNAGIAGLSQIICGENYTSFDFYVDPDYYIDYYQIYVLPYYVSSAYYQTILGTNTEEIDIIARFINVNTNEILAESTYQKYLSALNS